MTADQLTRAIMIPGAGSTADFIRRAFPPIPGVVDQVEALDPHHGNAGRALAELRARADRARRHGSRVIVGGVSFGAHVAAQFCADADREPEALLAVMPAWSGAPGPIGAATMAWAGQLASSGTEAILGGLQQSYPGDWVVAELSAAWTARPADELAAELAAVAQTQAPTPAELAAVNVPTVVVGLRDDPLHPIEVARAWATSIPKSRLRIIDREGPAADRAILGRVTFDALRGDLG